MDIFMGLLAAVCWGATDFLVGMNAKAVGVRQAVVFGQIVGLLLMISIIGLSDEQLDKLVAAEFDTYLLSGLSALLMLGGALSLSKAFAIGTTAVVAPLVSSYSIVTTVLAWLGGDMLSTWQVAGLLICFVGVMLASRAHRRSVGPDKMNNSMSVGFALLAALLYGVTFWIQGKYILPTIGPVNMLAVAYAIGLLFLMREASRLLRSWAVIRLKTFASLCGASLFNLGGSSAFSSGVLGGSISVVTVISTLSGAVAAALGYLFLHERLSLTQLCGVMMVLMGAVLLHVYG